jgi:hypothetical protein
MNFEMFLRDLITAVGETPLQSEPFDHVYMPNVFSPANYEQILDHLPFAGEYRQFGFESAIRADGHSTRHRFFFMPEHLMFLDAPRRLFLSALGQALCSPDLQRAFKIKFRGALEARFNRAVDEVDLFAWPMLIRDYETYSIAVHPDTPHKAITVQFYLPEDDQQTHLGTHFHAERNGPSVKAIPFLPASGYAFPVTPASWHSVPTTKIITGQRNSLMLTYYSRSSTADRVFLERELADARREIAHGGAPISGTALAVRTFKRKIQDRVMGAIGRLRT